MPCPMLQIWGLLVVKSDHLDWRTFFEYLSVWKSLEYSHFFPHFGIILLNSQKRTFLLMSSDNKYVHFQRERTLIDTIILSFHHLHAYSTQNFSFKQCFRWPSLKHLFKGWTQIFFSDIELGNLADPCLDFPFVLTLCVHQWTSGIL